MRDSEESAVLSEFSYCKETGVLFRNGKECSGRQSPAGYLRVSVNGKNLLQHRLAWRLATGAWPKCRVDHVNGVKTDNRFVNLRECDLSQNLMNCGPHVDNESGLKGVFRNKKRWAASISAYGKKRHLGTFDTPEEAHAAYRAAALEMHGDFARSGWQAAQ